MPTCWKVEGVLKSKLIPFVIMLTVLVTLSRYFNSPAISRMAPRKQNVLPFCTEGILDGIQYTSETKGRDFLSVRQRQSCRLRHYKSERIVSCLDQLSASKNANKSWLALSKKKERRNKFHIAFVGDSRVRILYLSFIKLIPDVDRESNIDPTARHKDADMISSLFGDLIVSFRWRPLIAGKVVDDLRRWIDILQGNVNDSQSRNYNSSDYPPDVLVLGMASWDMLQQEGDDHLWYQKGLEDLVPLFQEFLFLNKSRGVPGGESRKIIWLNQYTTFDFFASNDGANRVIFKEKLQLCNRIARRILKGSGVAVWDSGDAIAEEAVRACKLHHRFERVKDFMSVAYINCKDYIHAGYVALQQMTQLLYNDLCNNEFDL